MFFAAVTLQVVMLLGLGYPPMVTLASGKVVTFDTTPVDPWDMFRGDYVVLSYAFNNVPTTEHFRRGQHVYTVLRKDATGQWQAKRVTAECPAINSDEIVLAGKVDSSSGGSVRVRYGIEQAFVAEGTGRNVHSGHDVEADVAIDTKGHAVIKEVRHNRDILYRWRLI
jgi:uncharacterized membrane-anchored protein